MFSADLHSKYTPGVYSMMNKGQLDIKINVDSDPLLHLRSKKGSYDLHARRLQLPSVQSM